MMGRKKKKKPDYVDPTLPIAPMLDMSFQLMSFFILTFKPTPSEGQLSMFLPKLDDATQSQPQDQIIPEDKVDAYIIRVGRAEGRVGTITFKSDASEETLPGDDPLKALSTKLSSIPKPKSVKAAPKLTIEAPDDMKYSSLIKLMDTCRKSGYDNVGVSKVTGNAVAPK